MPTPTTRLRARLIDSGSELNTWGGNLNAQVFSLFDEAIAGVERITLSASTYTLSSANYATDQARNAGLIFQGSPAGTVTVTIPAVEKVYTCVNQTAQTVNLTCGGTAASLAAGDQATVWCDGTDCGLGSISVGTVNGLITNAALSGTLPGQAGNSGKYLQTNGSVPAWADVPDPDVGGGADATVTASATLTNTSAVVQSANMTAAAQSITLPDATTLSEGGRKFVIVNSGNRTFGVRSNGGTLLTVVPAGAVAELHLYDNATAAGGWGVTGRGLEPALPLVDYTFSTTYTTALEGALKMSDTVSLHFVISGAGGLYAVAVDHGASPATVGTPTLVESTATPSLVVPFRLSDTLAVVTYTRAGVTWAAAITLSGTTLTVGTPVSSGAGLSPSFTGVPTVAVLTASTMVVLRQTDARVLSVAGTVITWGAAATVGTTMQVALACYRVSDTTALALYIDDSGTAGAPYSIRGVVLSVSGTTVTVGTSNGVNDTLESTRMNTVSACQLSASKYLVTWGRGGPAGQTAAAFTVSGTAVSVGSPVQVGTVTPQDTAGNANRFQPNLYAIDASRALLTWNSLDTANPSHHVVLTESGGAVTAGAILNSLWSGSAGGNFPQTASGFLAVSSATNEYTVFAVTVSGTTLSVTGTFSNGAFRPEMGTSTRFGLSGGVFGIRHSATDRAAGLYHLFKFVANGPPRYLGPLSLNDFLTAAVVPVEVAANKVAFISSAGASQPDATNNNVRLQIVEFASS